MASAYNLDAVTEIQMGNSDATKSFTDNTTIKLEKINLTKIEMIDACETYSAPKEWNYFDKLSEDKMYELIDSIDDNGLISPVILWKIERSNIFKDSDEDDMYGFYGEDYLILSGHNRVQAYLTLYDATKKDKFLKIPAFVFDKITEFQAKNIIIDSNYTQRDLNTKEKVKSIIDKYHVYEKEKIKKGKVAEYIADDLKISPRMVFNYKKLATLIQPIKDMVYNDELPLTAALKLTCLKETSQEWLYNENRGYIIPQVLNRLKPDSGKKDVERAIESYKKSKEKNTKKITIEIPVELEDEFKKHIKDWIYNNSKRD